MRLIAIAVAVLVAVSLATGPAAAQEPTSTPTPEFHPGHAVDDSDPGGTIDWRAYIDQLPGGRYTAVLVIPVFATMIVAVTSRNPGITAIAFVSSLAAGVWLAQLNPLFWVLVVMFALGAAMIAFQFGFARR